MATINKKLIHFKSLSDFEARLAAGDVLSTSIVWIKDAKKIWTHGTYYDCNGGETLTEADILAMGFTKNAGTITGVSANGTSVATSGVANIPAATTSKYGVTKLSSATNSTSTSLAATPSAVKAAYDLANGKVSESDIFDNKTDGIIKAEALYNDKSQGGLIYALPTSRLALEDNCDDVLVARSEIFAGSPEQSMLQADAFYETTTGTIYGLPTSSIVTNGAEDEIIATQGYVDDAVANVGGAYNLTSLTKAQLDSFASGSTITINANDVSAIRANKIITITSNSGRCLMAAWSAQSSSVVQLTFLCDNVVYIAKASLQSNGTAKINAVAKHLVDANSGGGSYVPMNNTWYDSPSSVTIAPNSSVEIADLGLTSIAISLTEPTDNSVVNTYTLIIRKFGFGNAFTFDKTIIWANDNAPVFDTSEADEYVEISIKRSYEGVYLGTWAKFSIS